MKERVDIELLNEQNVGTAKIREYLAAKAGGRENLHYSKKDVNNQIGKAKKKLVGVDANALIDYFRRRQQDDPDFLFDIEPDEDKAVRNIFWVDGRSRRAYQEFGDVIVFDTTYQTNKYSMPMGPFIGVNHHRQSIFFGCALIRDEKKTTFYWLFTTWLQAMGGRKPKSIFTDQCPSMKAAIEKVFGVDTIHRCCLWHVMIKAKEQLGVIYGVVNGFKDEFSDLITYSWSIEDFEANWIAFVKKYKMEGNKHLKVMFDKRAEWAPAYFRETFCAGMSTTQRSESINVVTKIWMDSNTSLYDFATKFEKMVQGVYERESDEDIRTLNEIPQLSTTDPIEAEARRVYTRNMFSHFKAELKKCGGLRIHEVEKDKLYEVRPAKAKAKYKWYKPNRMVCIDKANGKADCDCKMFLFKGVLCSHALEVMRLTSIESFLPKHYILKRWTRDANASVKRGTNDRSIEGINLDSVMLNALTQRWQILSKEALKDHATYEMVCTKLDELVGDATKSNQRISRDTPTQRKCIVLFNLC
ncbi:protein FAR1-RELATED SEQUENCE 5-like [Carex rostrata]